MGHGKEVQITITDKAVSVRDFGRGIPLGKVVDCVSKINTGAKYNDDVWGRRARLIIQKLHIISISNTNSRAFPLS